MMNTAPFYKKWHSLSITPSNQLNPLSTLKNAPEPTAGEVFFSLQENLSKTPPTNDETWTTPYPFFVPFDEQTPEGGTEPEQKTILAKCSLSYTVDDWGSASLDGKIFVNLTSDVEYPGVYGGHADWSQTGEIIVESGNHLLNVFYANNHMKDPKYNKITCEYSGKVVRLEPGGQNDKDCPCSGDTCSDEGGDPPSLSRSVLSLAQRATEISYTSSSAGSSVIATSNEAYMRWSCNTGNLRGLGTSLSGKIQIAAKLLEPSLASTSSLLFNHPMDASLILPNEGLIPGARLEIRQGARTIALRYYLNGQIAPIGVDTAGGGRASIIDEGSRLCWREASGQAWEFSTSDGSLIAYIGEDGARIENVASYLCVNRDAQNQALQQIWSFWDGLLDVQVLSDTSYRISLYTADAVKGRDETTGLFTLFNGANSFKSFLVEYVGNQQDVPASLKITESTPTRPDYVVSWSQSEQKAWSVQKGTGLEAILTTRTRRELEPGDSDGMLNVWLLITEVSQGGLTASRIADVYQTTPVGDLLLTHVSAYESDQAQTTTYEYDASGNLLASIDPRGLRTEYAYDAWGRLLRTYEPYADGAYTRIYSTEYAFSAASDFNSDPSKTTLEFNTPQGVRQILLTEEYAYSIQNHIRRVEKRATAMGSTHTQLSIRETWQGDAPNTYARGRTHMIQGVDGVQTWYDYQASSAHGSLYYVLTETRVEGEPVIGQSTRQIRYVNSQGNTVRDENYALTELNHWVLIDGATYSYDKQNRLQGTVKDNGRGSSQELTCTGEVLWNIDENGVRTDYAYNSARQLIESTRSATQTSPEIITEYHRDALGRTIGNVVHTGSMRTEISNTYDLLGRLISQTDLLGRITRYEYSADGLTTTSILPSGAQQASTSYPDGQVAQTEATGQRKQYYRYDIVSDGLRTMIALTSTGENMIVSRTITNGFGQLIRTGQPDSLGSTFYTHQQYNALGQLIRQYVENGPAPMIFAYDLMGNLRKKTLLLNDQSPDDILSNRIEEMSLFYQAAQDGIYNIQSSTRYNIEGDPLTSTSKTLISGLSSQVESKTLNIDERGQLSTQTSFYDAQILSGRLIESTSPASDMAAQVRSIDGFTLEQRDYNGLSTSYTRVYSETGMRLTQTDPRGNTGITLTDTAGRAISTTDATGAVTHMAYELNSNQISCITNALGEMIHYRYDLAGRKTAQFGTAIQPCLFCYDDAGHMIEQTLFRVDGETITDDPTGRTDGDTTSWQYDILSGLELSKTYPDGQKELRSYDRLNRQANITNARGQILTYAYDPQTSELTSIIADNEAAPAQYFRYNWLGLLTEVIDACGTRIITYDTYLQQQSEENLNIRIHEQYDTLGRPTGYRLEYNQVNQLETTLSYDSKGRLGSLSVNGLSTPFTWSYETQSGLLSQLAYANGIILKLTYEQKRNLITKLDYWRPNSTNSAVKTEYEYDILGRPRLKKDYPNTASPTATHALTYNSCNELIQSQVSGQGGGTYAYDYDNIGNRKTAQELTQEIAYDANTLNQYTQIDNDADIFVPEYDEDGNQTLIKTSTGIWNVLYNAQNRPIIFTSHDGLRIIDCVYDYRGRRVEKKLTVNGSVTYHARFVYRGYLQLAEINLLAQDTPIVNRYVWDPNEPSATRILLWQPENEEYLYPCYDLTKNTLAIFGQARGRRALYTYSPFGAITSGEGNVSAQYKFRYSCEMSDDELGLVYYNYRHYNPQDGRWINRDPIGMEGGYNLYGFVGNSVMWRGDMLGLKAANLTIDTTFFYGIDVVDYESTVTYPATAFKTGTIINDKQSRKATYNFQCNKGKLTTKGSTGAHTIIKEGNAIDNKRVSHPINRISLMLGITDKLDKSFEFQKQHWSGENKYIDVTIEPFQLVYQGEGTNAYLIEGQGRGIAYRNGKRNDSNSALSILVNRVHDRVMELPFVADLTAIAQAVTQAIKANSIPEISKAAIFWQVKVCCNSDGSIQISQHSGSETTLPIGSQISKINGFGTGKFTADVSFKLENL